eukprot:8413632-Alexandrium_andersonii.AAC.1
MEAAPRRAPEAQGHRQGKGAAEHLGQGRPPEGRRPYNQLAVGSLEWHCRREGCLRGGRPLLPADQSGH